MNAVIVFSAVLIAFTGELILLWVGGFNTSVAVWVRFIALFCIAVDDVGIPDSNSDSMDFYLYNIWTYEWATKKTIG